jgi:hypothetical protein
MLTPGKHTYILASMVDKQTLGPWSRDKRDGRLIIDGKGNEIAMVIGTVEETEGSAKLIAAAPELLGALQAMVLHCQFDAGAGFVLRRARTAISNAV